MGQSYSSLTDRNLGAAGSDITELPELSYDKSLGSARFLKTIRARHIDGTVVVKVFVKPTPNFSLRNHLTKLEGEREALTDVPNAFPYQRIVETDRAGYLIRQYLYSSLYDRISTRPFLEEVEKRWIAFQLLCGLRDCHAWGICHGDIKTENVMVTSWNWIFLADFASFKPAYLPEDNPADFTFFFDTSSRRTCYVAPERFVSTEHPKQQDLTEAMDIFSLGCVIAELFLEGTPLFNLSQLFKYRKGEYDPAAACLDKIEDLEIRSLILHMINLNPSERFSAEGYLDKWRRKVFPEYFYSFLHQYVAMITDPSSGRSAISQNYDHSGEADDRIDKIYHDFDKISFFLSYQQESDSENRPVSSNKQIIPVHLDIPNYRRNSPAVRRHSTAADDGTLIFLSLVVSSMRNTLRTTARMRACDLMLALAERISDEAKLDRCLPYVVALLEDKADIVKVSAIRTITQLLDLVDVVSPVNAYVFPEYVLPKLKPLTQYDNPLVRATLAACLATLADCASKFLTLAQLLSAQGILPTADPEAEATSAEASYHSLYDVSRKDLIQSFQEYATAFLTDSDPSVRRAILPGVSRLCLFFGRQIANDVILSHLNTYLNDLDWMLRSSFFETIVGVAAFVGVTGLEEYIMPLMLPSLTDPEEFVVERVLRSLAGMAELGLFQRAKIWELTEIIARFSIHPNLWIRRASVAFITSAVKWLSPSEIQCIIIPIVLPYLRTEIVGVSELDILEYLKGSLPRPVFDQAVTWALIAGKSNFWKGAQDERTFSFGSGSESFSSPSSSHDQLISAFSKAQLNEEDQKWLSKLRSLGMSAEDEWKLAALREYIWRMARSKPRLPDIDDVNPLNQTLELNTLRIVPQTIFFNYTQNYLDILDDRPHVSILVDALMDASETIGDPNKRRNLQLSRHDNRMITITNIDPVLDTPTTLTTATQGHGEPSKVSKTNEPTEGDYSRMLEASKQVEAHNLSHKSSMISLLSKGQDNCKAPAETATIYTTAFGTLDQPLSRDTPQIEASDSRPYKFRAAHSYDGNDPHILQLLDNMFIENYPSDYHEFGPTFVPVSRRHPIKKNTGRSAGNIWKPDGGLVAQFAEHAGPINRVAVAPDHSFFITGSDDGTVKIWDTSRLEKNVASRAKQTYKHNINSKVKALCFVENTHCFISAAMDGSLHIVRVDCQVTPTSSKQDGRGETIKYGKLKTLRKYGLPTGEYVVWMEHFRTESNSVLLMATNMSNIIALELRTMKILYTLNNPIHHGTPTCFCIDRRRQWLAVGTMHGIIDMYDLRFRLRLRAWGLPGSTTIHRMCMHPTKGRQKWICVAGGSGQGEVTVWDVEKTQCREVYRAGGGKDSGRGYEPWKVDDEKPESVLGRFTNAPLLEPNASGVPDRGVRAIVVAADIPENGGDNRGTMGFMISGGGDRKIRYWNLSHIEHSSVISGLDSEEAKPMFTSSHPTPTLVLNTESASQPDSSTMGTNARNPSSSKKNKNSGRPPRSTVISAQQQQLLKTHLDCITDVAFIEVPYGMCISADRSGTILVFQ